MNGSEPYERRELTGEDLQSDREALEQARRDFDAAKKRPPVQIRSPGKFAEPLGMYEDGSFQPPLTEVEKAHNEEVRRRAREEGRQASGGREEREDDGRE